MNPELIRNFSIVAHIDHGKSTLADRILEKTGAISIRERREQYLDKMDLERERGITIKSHPVRINYRARDGQTYCLNLIDTPGHVDFSYEVSRSIAACEGVVLLVDAVDGVQAQTIAHAYLCSDQNLKILTVINKTDLPSADPDRVKKEIEGIIGLDTSKTILASAKEGWGTEEILEAVIRDIPPPGGSGQEPLQALIFDSWYDSFQGVIILIRVFSGQLSRGMSIKLFNTGNQFLVSELGIFTPSPQPVESLGLGEVGYIIAGIKDIREAPVGDTVMNSDSPILTPLPGFRPLKPMVFTGLYPQDASQYQLLREALGKLHLNDPALTYEPETSQALGYGFRCGYLGPLHAEIVQERLEREFNLSLISTAPTVAYRITRNSGEIEMIENPNLLPETHLFQEIEEPIVLATIHSPTLFLGAILKLCEEKQGVQKKLDYPTPNRILLVYELPLSEIMLDFYDRLKSLSRGLASLDYEPMGFRPGNLVKLQVLVNGEPVDPLSLIVNRDQADFKGRDLIQKLKELIPRQLFDIAIQAAIGSRIIARESIKAKKKAVTAKCYGGDITRKRKLWAKQKEGKKRMKRIGVVDIPQEAFLAVLKTGPQ